MSLVMVLTSTDVIYSYDEDLESTTYMTIDGVMGPYDDHAAAQADRRRMEKRGYRVSFVSFTPPGGDPH